MDLTWGIGAYRVKLRRRLKSTRKEQAREHLNRPVACEMQKWPGKMDAGVRNPNGSLQHWHQSYCGGPNLGMCHAEGISRVPRFPRGRKSLDRVGYCLGMSRMVPCRWCQRGRRNRAANFVSSKLILARLFRKICAAAYELSWSLRSH